LFTSFTLSIKCGQNILFFPHHDFYLGILITQPTSIFLFCKKNIIHFTLNFYSLRILWFDLKFMLNNIIFSFCRKEIRHLMIRTYDFWKDLKIITNRRDVYIYNYSEKYHFEFFIIPSRMQTNHVPHIFQWAHVVLCHNFQFFWFLWIKMQIELNHKVKCVEDLLNGMSNKNRMLWSEITYKDLKRMWLKKRCNFCGACIYIWWR
jgi:hypothetical protein